MQCGIDSPAHLVLAKGVNAVAAKGNMQSVRTDIIKTLNRIADEAEFPIVYDKDSSLQEIRLISDLIDAGHLDGEYVPDERGVPCAAAVTRITLSGRAYVDELENQRYRQSPRGRAVAMVKYCAIFLSGIVATLLTQWLAKLFDLN